MRTNEPSDSGSSKKSPQQYKKNVRQSKQESSKNFWDSDNPSAGEPNKILIRYSKVRFGPLLSLSGEYMSSGKETLNTLTRGLFSWLWENK